MCIEFLASLPLSLLPRLGTPGKETGKNRLNLHFSLACAWGYPR